MLKEKNKSPRLCSGQAKIIFIGTPAFAVPALESLIKNNNKPMIVITEPDRPKGRGRILTSPPVKDLAQKYNIPVLQPERIENCKLKIENLQPDLAIVCAYGQIIPKEILEIPKFGILNIHPSLLPKYRGATPIQTAILNGDKQTGVTIMKMDEKMDHGKIVKSQKLKVKSQNYIELSKELANTGAKLLIQILPGYLNGKIITNPQNHTQATFTQLIKKGDGLIDWQKGAQKIDQQIRAYFPWPGSYFMVDNKRFIIHQAHLAKNQLVIDEIQPENKPVITFSQFKLGYPKILTKLPNFVKI